MADQQFRSVEFVKRTLLYSKNSVQYKMQVASIELVLDIHIFGGEVATGFRDGKGKREGSGCSAGGVGTSGPGAKRLK